MGGGDANKQEKERDDLVAVLKTGSLPAPLREASESNVGPTLGRDAIDKTKLIITGASRAGKSSMVAAAFDERLMGAPVVTGGGGVGAYRFAG